MRIVKYLVLISLLYIYIYNPLFRALGVGPIKLLLACSLAFILLSGFLARFLKIFQTEILLILVLISYSIGMTLIGQNTLVIPYTHLIWFLECFLIPAFLLLLFKDVFKRLNWETVVVHTGFIASLITLFLILNPSVNQLVRDAVIEDNLDTVLPMDEMFFRGFSIAESSSYGYGIVQGLILAVCLVSARKSALFMVPVLFLFISIIFNARIGIAPALISFILLIAYRRFKTRNLIAIVAVTALAVWFFQQSSFAEENEVSLKWAFGIFTDLEGVAKGTKNTTVYNTIFQTMIFFPSELSDLIFGNGEKVFAANGRASDVGYVIQIFRGGLIYLSLMLIFLWMMYARSKRVSPDKLLPLIFFLTILIANVKGNAFFNPNSFFRLFSFYYVYIIFISHNLVVPPAPVGDIELPPVSQTPN